MRIALAAVVFIFFGCRNGERQQLFTKIPDDRSGVFFNNVNMEDENYNVLVYEYFYNGGGVAIGDINNDGLPDIYFTANQKANRLYLNKGNFTFEDITEKSGTACKQGWKTGISMVDINADGYLDIYVCRSAANNPAQRENSLYINNGDLSFTDRAKEYGLNDNGYSTQASFLDHDRDGDVDMFLLNHSVSSIVRNYDIRTENKKDRVPFVGNTLYENNNGKFTDVSEDRRIYGPAHNYGLGVCYSDINNDGWLDLYTSNDYTGSDNLLLNVEGKSFLNVTDSLLTHISRFSMGTDIADVNNDGFSDILTLDMLPDNNQRQKELFWPEQYDVYTEMVSNGLHHQFMRNMLHLNNGAGQFSEIGQFSGISNTDWSWAALFADYDNDGFQDLFVSNGYKRDYTNNDFLKYRADQMTSAQRKGKGEDFISLMNKIPSTKINNYLFQNIDGWKFSDVSDDWGMGNAGLTHGAAYADLDNDGDLDLVMNNMDETAGIYQNNAEVLVNNNYLKIRLRGNDQNYNGLGAKVTVYFGNKLMMRELCPYRGFQSSVEPVLHFGFGRLTRIDSVVVIWPRGTVQKLTNVAVNQTMVLRQQDATEKLLLSEIDPGQSLLSEEKGKIPFKHLENPFIDFKVQSLLPRMYSTTGPALAGGDVDNDGLMDLYFGGASGQDGALLVGEENATFAVKDVPSFSADGESEDTDAVFFDIDNDKDLDLYVVTGGFEFNNNDPALEDKLYRNDHGNFRKINLPEMFSSGSCVRPHDFDRDGDLDLFVGGRVTPGRYPYAPESYLLRNDGTGNFSIVTEQVAPAIKQIGMVTDAAWVDLSGDGSAELIIVGEWMGIRIFESNDGMLTEGTSHYLKDNLQGFWNCILVHDFDKDGDPDLIAGNYGLNNQIKPSSVRPATLHYDDFDDNGSVDPILCYYVKDKSYPFPSRDELTEQLPYLKKRFTNYGAYANATIEDILTPRQLSDGGKLEANHFETTYFQNDGGTLRVKHLPVQIQFAPVFALAAMDVNRDGNSDLISGGNLSATRARTGVLKGNTGFVFLGDGKGGFSFVEPFRSGICIREDIRKIVVTGDRVVFAANNAGARTFKRQNTDVVPRLMY